MRVAPRILHKYRYVSPRDVARMILKNKRVCSRQDYLGCVVAHHELQHVTQQFASLLALPHIHEPDAFLEWYRKNHDTLNNLTTTALTTTTAAAGVPPRGGGGGDAYMLVLVLLYVVMATMPLFLMLGSSEFAHF